jgi:coenzyme F420-0:L-glutamate ligase/coenzyme F420-1:gamma-L-glutamate ligase
MQVWQKHSHTHGREFNQETELVINSENTSLAKLVLRPRRNAAVMKSDFYRVLYGRRSIRFFKEQSVDAATLRKVLEAAIAAPSAHNAQPARFFVIPNGKARSNLIARMSELYLQDLTDDNMKEQEARAVVNRSQTILTSAPVLILAGLTMRDMWSYLDEKRKSHEYVMAVQSTAAAIQNLLLSAYAEGLASCWLCAPLFAKDIVVEVLGLEDDIDPQAFIILGYAPESNPMPLRKPFEEMVHML